MRPAVPLSVLALLTLCPGCTAEPPISAPATVPPPDGGTADAAPPDAGPVGLGYEPLEAAGLELLDGTDFAPDADARRVLSENGFVILRDPRFEDFGRALASIYAHDLPVYISADAVLEAMHRSSSAIFQLLERSEMLPRLEAFLAAMRDALLTRAGEMSETARADLDLLLTVAASLLTGSPVAPTFADPADVAGWVASVQTAEGVATVELFGADRLLDYSQFRPRSHYAASEPLGRYFRAMRWLGHVDLRMVEIEPSGARTLRRRQVENALWLGRLADGAARSEWADVEAFTTAFVGPADAMTLDQVDALLADLGVAAPGDVAGLSDAQILHALEEGGYGHQRIAGHFLLGGEAETIPLPRSFSVFPARYVVDSHVLSNLVYDRVGRGTIPRMMPSTLDVAYAVLGNDTAHGLLSGELARFDYGADLEAARAAVDARGAEGWSGTLYDRWLYALRGLTRPDDPGPLEAGLPSVARTDAWARRLTNTQLGSWAELRHDTLLYAKQSQTGGFACSYPDAYVDPYPELWARIAAYADHGRRTFESLAQRGALGIPTRAAAYFEGLASAARVLTAIAARQLRGEPLTEEHLAFINQAVTMTGCVQDTVTGWYAQLLFGLPDAGRLYDEPAPIADVHTQPTDAAGAIVGRILHAGVGRPRTMIVTVDGCEGPRAYVGPVFAYHEIVTEDFERLDDLAFTRRVTEDEPRDVPWMDDLVVGPTNAPIREAFYPQP